jgi:hypothetical protein
MVTVRVAAFTKNSQQSRYIQSIKKLLRFTPLKNTLTILIIFVFSSYLAACDNKGVDSIELVSDFGQKASTIVKGPWRIHDNHPPPCRLDPRPDISPSESEYPTFFDRLYIDHTIVLHPIDAACASKAMTGKDTNYWLARNDPVAMYVYLSKKYPHISQICRNIKEIDKTLELGGSMRINITYSAKTIARVPELFYLKKLFHNACDDGVYNVDKGFFFGSEFNPYLGPVWWGGKE